MVTVQGAGWGIRSESEDLFIEGIRNEQEMNKKDCESIGYLLSIARSPEEIRERLFELDDRIEPEFIGFEEAQGRDDDVMERFNEIMEEENGPHWCLRKKSTYKHTSKEVIERARRDIYGEDYNPTFFDRS